MYKQSSKDRTDLCHFAFADGRRCTMPQAPGSESGLCYFHHQQYADRLDQRFAGEQISLCLDPGINTACDLSAALTKLFRATALGYIKPKTCSTLTYLANLMLQTQLLARQEYESAFEQPWPDVVYDSICFKKERGEYTPPSTSHSPQPPGEPKPSSESDETSEPAEVPQTEPPDEDCTPVPQCPQADILPSPNADLQEIDQVQDTPEDNPEQIPQPNEQDEVEDVDEAEEAEEVQEVEKVEELEEVEEVVEEVPQAVQQHTEHNSTDISCGGYSADEDPAGCNGHAAPKVGVPSLSIKDLRRLLRRRYRKHRWSR
jgi:hypothetical protein